VFMRMSSSSRLESKPFSRTCIRFSRTFHRMYLVWQLGDAKGICALLHILGLDHESAGVDIRRKYVASKVDFQVEAKGNVSDVANYKCYRIGN